MPAPVEHSRGTCRKIKAALLIALLIGSEARSIEGIGINQLFERPGRPAGSSDSSVDRGSAQDGQRALLAMTLDLKTRSIHRLISSLARQAVVTKEWRTLGRTGSPLYKRMLSTPTSPADYADLERTTLGKRGLDAGTRKAPAAGMSMPSSSSRASGHGKLDEDSLVHVEVFWPYGTPEVVGVPSNEGDAASPCDDRQVMLVIQSSVWFNFFLLLCKLYAFLKSRSLAVLATLVDSAIDSVGQGVVLYTKHLQSRGQVKDYPVGRGRLEPLGVLVCAVLMGMASMLVIETAIRQLVTGLGAPVKPKVIMSINVVGTLLSTIALKAALLFWCHVVGRKYHSEAVEAIKQDNLNDVLSNIVALLAPATSKLGKDGWVFDPAAACLISFYIIGTWLKTAFDQADMIVGKEADAEFLQKARSLAEGHSTSMLLDKICAYHFGPKYLVELEMVMPKATTLLESHDVGITLQHKIESLEEVERCFVHIDYQHRMYDDHNPMVPVDQKVHGPRVP